MSLWDNQDSEQWDSSVPADLQPAVKHLRELFDKAHFNFGWTTRMLCFAHIHQPLNESDLKDYVKALVQLKAYIPPLARKTFNDRVAEGTVPGIFKAYLDFSFEGRAVQAQLVLKELLEIGAANERRLSISAIDWAESQTKHLVRSQPYVGKDTLLSGPDCELSEVRNFWKKSPLWQTLIISSGDRKGVYSLNLPPKAQIEVLPPLDSN